MAFETNIKGFTVHVSDDYLCDVYLDGEKVNGDRPILWSMINFFIHQASSPAPKNPFDDLSNQELRQMAADLVAANQSIEACLPDAPFRMGPVYRGRIAANGQKIQAIYAELAAR